MLQHIGDDEFDHVLRQAHIVIQVGKGDLRLDHPELSGMPGGVGVLRPEGGAEGVDVLKGHGKGFTVELAGDGEVGGLAEEILAEIHLAVLGLGDVVQVEGGHLEHFARALAVGAGDQGRVDIDKVPLLEEFMDGVGRQTADTEHCLEQIGAGPQMGHGAQELHAVALFLHGIVAGGIALNHHRGSLNFKRLLGIGRQQHTALHNQRRAHVHLGNGLEILHGIGINHLNRGEISTVIQGNKAKLFALSIESNPAANLHFLAGIFRRVLEQLSDRNQIHWELPLFRKNID